MDQRVKNPQKKVKLSNQDFVFDALGGTRNVLKEF